MPHNLVILCLCYANQIRSEVPILSSNRDTARLGRGDRILLPSVIPAQVQGRHNTTRSTLTIGYPLRIQRRQTLRRITPGIPSFLAVASVCRTQHGIWGWPVQSPRHPQVLIPSQKPRRLKEEGLVAINCLCQFRAVILHSTHLNHVIFFISRLAPKISGINLRNIRRDS